MPNSFPITSNCVKVATKGRPNHNSSTSWETLTQNNGVQRGVCILGTKTKKPPHTQQLSRIANNVVCVCVCVCEVELFYLRTKKACVCGQLRGWIKTRSSLNVFSVRQPRITTMWFAEATLAATPDGSVYVRNELTATQRSLQRAVFKDTLARERNEALVKTLDLPHSEVCGSSKGPYITGTGLEPLCAVRNHAAVGVQHGFQHHHTLW